MNKQATQLNLFVDKFAFHIIILGVLILAVITVNSATELGTTMAAIEWHDVAAEVFIILIISGWVLIAKRLRSSTATFLYFYSGCTALIWLMAVKLISEWLTALPWILAVLELSLSLAGLILVSLGLMFWLADHQRLILQLDQNVARYRVLSQTDTLTGLNNRGQFDEIVEAIIEDKRNFSLLLIDLDHFKTVNDRFGHPMGDTVLEQTARLITRQVREQDYAFRLGGEEFALMLVNCPRERSNRSAEDIRHAIKNNQYQTDTNDLFSITASIGISHRAPNDTPLEIYRRADTALYQAKSGGRDRVISFKGQ